MSAAVVTQPKAELKRVRWHDLIEPGMVVNWFDGGLPESPCCAAIVARKGNDSLCLHIIDPNNHNFMIRDGCREMSDPKAKNDMRAGGWEPTPFTKKLIELVS